MILFTNDYCCLTAVFADGCPPGRHAGLSKNSPSLREPRDTSQEKLPLSSTDPEQRQASAGRTRASDHQDTCASGKEAASAGAGLNPALTHLRSHKPSQQMASPSQADCISVCVRSKSRDLYLQGADKHPDSEPHIQENPVRDRRRADWSMSSGDSDTSLQVSRPSHVGRRVEPVKPFSISVSLASELPEFGGPTPDVSDLTVYNEIVKKTPHTQTITATAVYTHREPTPGSEAEEQRTVCSRPLFSELRQRQQDSGFDSPYYNHK